MVDFSQLPSMPFVVEPPRQRDGWLGPGLRAGAHELVGSLGGALEAGARLVGADSVADWGRDVAVSRAAQAQAAGRPDLEDKWGPTAIGYKVAKTLPSLGATLLGAAAFPAAAVPAAAARIGAAAPAVLGGGSAEAGLLLAKQALGATAAGFPTMVGGNMEAARYGGRTPDRADAAAAIGLAVPQSAVGAVAPVGLMQRWSWGTAENMAKRALTGAAVMGPTMGAQSAVNTALTQTMGDPNMSVRDRAAQVVDSFLTGMVTGGVTAGALHAVSPRRPKVDQKTTNDDLAGAVDRQMGRDTPDRQMGRDTLDRVYEPTSDKLQQKSDMFGGLEDQTAPQMADQPPRPVPDVTPDPLSMGLPGIEDRAAFVSKWQNILSPAKDGQRSSIVHPGVDFINAQGLASDADLAHALVQTGFKKPPKWMAEIGQKLGLLDAKAKPIDLDAEAARLDAAMVAARDRNDATALKALVPQAQKIAATRGLVQEGASSAARRAEAARAEIEAATRPPEPIREEFTRQPELFSDPAQPADVRAAQEAARQELVARGTADAPSLFAVEGERVATRPPEPIREEFTRQPELFSDPAQPADVRAVEDVQRARVEAARRALVAEGTGDEPSLFATPEEILRARHDEFMASKGDLNKLGPAGRQARQQFFDASLPTDDVQLTRAVNDAIAQVDASGKSRLPNWLQDLAQRTGLVDEAGATRDIAAEIAAKDAQIAKLAGKDQPGAIKRLARLQAEREELLRLKQTHDAAQQPEERPAVAETQVDMTEPRGQRAPEPWTLDEQNEAFRALSNEERPYWLQDMEPNTAPEGRGQAPEGTQSVSVKPVKASASRRTQVDVVEPHTRLDRELKRATDPIFEALEADRLPAELRARVERAVGPLAEQTHLSDAQIKAIREASEALNAHDYALRKTQDEPASAREPKVEPANEPAGERAWLDRHAADLGGDVVYADDGHGLIRTTNKVGDTIYVPVDRASGARARVDVDQAKPGWMTPDVRRRLRAAAANERRKDVVAAQRAPDGPFTGAERNVVKSDSVPNAAVGYVHGLMKLLGLGDVRTMVVDPRDMMSPDARERYNLHGDHARALKASLAGTDGEVLSFGPRGRDFAISVDGQLPAHKRVEIMAHEVGHIVKYTAFDSATPGMKSEIMRAHAEWVARTHSVTARELIESVRNREMAKELIDTLGDRADQPAKNLGETYSYLTSFDEFFADHVSRWATTDAKPRTLVDRFFKRVADKMRELVSAITGTPFADRMFLPDPTVKRFLDSMGPGNPVEWAGRGDVQAEARATAQPKPANLDQSNDFTGRAFAGAKIVGDKIEAHVGKYGTADVGHGLRKLLYTVLTPAAIVRDVTRILPEAAAIQKVASDVTAAKNVLATTFSQVIKQYRVAPKKVQDLLPQVANATYYGLDPTKPLEPQLVAKPDASADAIAAWKSGNAAYQAMRQAGAGNMVPDMLANHRSELLLTAANSVDKAIHAIAPDAQIALPGNALDRYRLQADLHGKPQEVAEFFRADLQQRRDILAELVAARRAEFAELPKGARRAALRGIKLPMMELASADAVLKDQTPYLHLGRKGDFFVAAKLALGEDGKVSKETMQRVGDMLAERGFGDLLIHSGFDDQATFFARTETVRQAEQLQRVLEDARAQGLIDKDHSISSGMPKDMSVEKSFVRDALQRAFERLRGVEFEGEGDEASGANKMQGAMLGELGRVLLDTMPKSDIMLVQRDRKMVHGSSSRAMDNYAFRATLGIHAMAESAYSTARAVAVDAAQKKIFELKAAGDIRKTVHAQQALDALISRPSIEPNRGIDMAKGTINSFFLMASPMYALQQVAQPILTALPEIGKVRGFAKTAQAMMGQLPVALKVMKAAWALDNPTAQLSVERLTRNGVDRKTAQYLVDVQARGGIGMNGLVHEMTQAVRDVSTSRASSLLTLANATSTYAETTSRVWTALTARAMHGDRPGVADYAANVIANSLGEFGGHATSRLMSGGTSTLGGAGRIISQFQHYPTMLLSKLYNEVGDAFGKGRSAEERAQARKFLAGHLAAMTVVAGTLNFPGAQFVTGAGNKLLGLFDGEDHDLEGSYRGFLKDVLGTDLGEALARGAPRLLGLDMKSLGEGEMLPFTKLVNDKRRWEEVTKDWLADLTGPAPNTMAQWVEGGRDIFDGNYLRGMQKLLPTALRGPADAYMMAQYGYETADGKPLPITPTSADVVKRAFGMQPADRAAYREMAHANSQAQAALEYRTSTIRNNLLHAIRHNDNDKFQAWATKANDLARSHPTHPILPTIAQSVQTQLRQDAIARATGLPTGVQVNDIQRRKALYGYQQ